MDMIFRATPSHLHQVRHVLRNARQRFINFGDEDLTTLLRDGVTVIGVGGGQPWGVMLAQRTRIREPHVDVAPGRVNLRGVAFAPGRSPIVDTPRLTMALLTELAGDAPLQVIIYADSWLVAPLKTAGFSLVDRLETLELNRLQTRASLPFATASASGVSLRPARLDDLPALARLDAETFPSLWRLDRQELLTLLLPGRVQVARRSGRLVGYSALSMPVFPTPEMRAMGRADSTAQLARLAVHPAAQGAGVGRQLLTDVLNYARTNGASGVTLNTQTSNQRSLALYRAFGFQNGEKITPVLTYMLTAQTGTCS